MYNLRRSSFVSTHSRPKAAGTGGQTVALARQFQHTAARRRLGEVVPDKDGDGKFQHTAARRRLVAALTFGTLRNVVSTHSRPKAAGNRYKTAAPTQ